MRRHPSVASIEKINLFRAIDETDVSHLIDEVAGTVDHSLAESVGPELFRLLELLKDLNRLCNINCSIRLTAGRIAEFTNARMPRASIVPAVRTFLGDFVRHLVELNSQIRLEPLDHGCKRCRHNAASDQDDIGIVDKC